MRNTRYFGYLFFNSTRQLFNYLKQKTISVFKKLSFFFLFILLYLILPYTLRSNILIISKLFYRSSLAVECTRDFKFELWWANEHAVDKTTIIYYT